MIWDDVSKFLSGFIVPILFVIIIVLSFVVMILRKYNIESWEDLKNLVRFSKLELVYVDNENA